MSWQVADGQVIWEAKAMGRPGEIWPAHSVSQMRLMQKGLGLARGCNVPLINGGSHGVIV